MSTPNANSDWYYYDDNSAEKFGPVSKDQLQSFARNGAITPNTVIESPSGKQTPAAQLSWLVFPPQARPTPPPIPPKAPNSGSGVSTPPSSANNSPAYFYYDDNTAERKGPYTVEQLNELAAKGAVKPKTMVESKDGKTDELRNRPELIDILPPLPENGWFRWFRWFRKASEQSGQTIEKMPWVRQIPLIFAGLLLCTVAVFALRWLFSAGSFDIDKPTPSLIAKADNGNPKACVQLINYYLSDGLVDDLVKAAASDGSFREQEVFGKVAEKVRKYARKGAKGAEDENPYAQICKGYTYFGVGSGAAEENDSFGRMLKAFCKAAEQGNAEGAVAFAFLANLVNMTFDDREGARDLKEYVKKYDEQAEEWLHKAAEQGHARAQLLLGLFYFTGSKIGVTKDEQESMKWIYKAAAQRNSFINNTLLGLAMYMEDVSERDAKKAFNLLYKRANGNWLSNMFYKKKPKKEEIPTLAVLQSTIASCYEDGRGVNENLSEAFKWYRKAAETEAIKPLYVESLFKIAQMYDKGEGTAEDQKEAIKLYKKAAEEGYLLAQYRVAQMYDEGEGVDEDRDEAKVWYRKVLENNTANDMLLLFSNTHYYMLQNRMSGIIPKAIRNKIEDEAVRIRNAKETSAKKLGNNRSENSRPAPSVSAEAPASAVPRRPFPSY